MHARQHACTDASIWTDTHQHMDARTHSVSFCVPCFSQSHTHTHSLLRWHPTASCHCLSINSCNHIHRRWTRRWASRFFFFFIYPPTCWFHGFQMTTTAGRSYQLRSWGNKRKHTVFTYEANKAVYSVCRCRGHLGSADIQTQEVQGGYAWKCHTICHIRIINNNKG